MFFSLSFFKKNKNGKRDGELLEMLVKRALLLVKAKKMLLKFGTLYADPMCTVKKGQENFLGTMRKTSRREFPNCNCFFAKISVHGVG